MKDIYRSVVQHDMLLMGQRGIIVLDLNNRLLNSKGQYWIIPQTGSAILGHQNLLDWGRCGLFE
jgi:hypothetical protein